MQEARAALALQVANATDTRVFTRYSLCTALPSKWLKEKWGARAVWRVGPATMEAGPGRRAGYAFLLFVSCAYQ